MMAWYGYRGKILDIDLSSRTAKALELDAIEAQNFIGGAGLNAWLLYKSFRPDITPLSPENPLIFGAGPLTATSYPASSRSTFTALSPLTGIFGDANGGGYFATMVRQAGYDHLIVRGASDRPCYILIGRKGECTIEEAGDLWGMDVPETDRVLGERHKGSMAASIGTAGEKLVSYANILTRGGGNSWSRTGMGAVMGSKRLKAIVANGREKIMLHDEEGFKSLSEKIKHLSQTDTRSMVFSRWGTVMQISLFAAMGLLYGNNLSHRLSLKEAGRIGITPFSRETDFTVQGCYRCPLKCEKRYTLKNNPHKGEEGHKYELGYACSLGFNVGINNVNEVLHLADVCNTLGLDMVEFSSSAATAIELFREGILKHADTDGIELDWNRPAAVEALARKVAKREGIGDLLAGGVRKMAETLGGDAHKFAIHFKGLSEPAHDSPPFLLSFSVATRGGDHLKGMPILLLDGENRELAATLFGATKETMDLYSNGDKGRAIWWHENYKTMIDSLGICFFLATVLLPAGNLTAAQCAEAYRAATGYQKGGRDLFLAGERAYLVEKAINARLGVDRSRDCMKARQEAGSWGSSANLDHPGMLDEYYHYRGCSQEGLLLGERLKEAGLTAVAKDLEREGKLGKEPVYSVYRSLALAYREPPAAPGKKAGESLKEKVTSNKKLMETLTGDGVVNTAIKSVEIKRSLRKFSEKYGTSLLVGAGTAAAAYGIWHLFSRDKEKTGEKAARRLKEDSL
ncbi:MAG: aldehyde ferredoxin oxidoreductase C-terminal domain-containing protein [Candidatus Eremiobacteraeota bacterium]|nr:aldehyde ferredoxin oxidoreductase C-terminal domain-containing protein [Candidatus Eremiobacteraeota bacterium]